MARYQVVVDISQFPVNKTSGASVQVNLPGKGGMANPIYADAIGGPTLSNPFTVTSPKVDFYMAKAQSVDIVITPTGAAAVTLPNIGVSHQIPQLQTLKMPSGMVVKWYLV